VDNQLVAKNLLYAPNLILPEVSGSVTRRTGTPLDGQDAVAKLTNLPVLRLVEIEQAIADLAAEVAANLRLRGADAVYVALAQRLNFTLVTWDNEVINRAGATISVITP
jgi:predicted nucleic acid-binding protein